jgi:endonuclease/exonuclease/phosphatase family metal-dependent hydrolase
MRRLIAFFLVFLVAPCLGRSEQIRLTTWKLSGTANIRPGLPPADVELKQLQEAARGLNALGSDVILLQAVRDREFCDRLAALLGPARYHVLVCSGFPDGMSVPNPRGQVAILSKLPALGAWAERWKKEGNVEPSGGFAFAFIRFGAVDVGFYTVQLKENRSRGNGAGEARFDILQRELAARQLVRHVTAVKGNITNRAFVIAGDFNTNPDQNLFAAENTLRAIEEAGFKSIFRDVPLQHRITSPGTGRSPNATFDYVFARNVEFTGTFQIAASLASIRLPVTCELVLPSAVSQPEKASLPVVGGTLPRMLRDKRIALGAAAVLVLLLAVLSVRRGNGRRRSGPQFALAGFADAYSAGPGRRALPGARQSPGAGAASQVPYEVPSARHPQSTAWQERVLEAERRAGRATAMVKVGLLPHLARMLSGQLFSRVIRQRAQLLQTQQASRALVLEFEQRLAAIHFQFQARLAACERQINELQNELAAKEQELSRMRAAATRQARSARDEETQPVDSVGQFSPDV